MPLTLNGSKLILQNNSPKNETSATATIIELILFTIYYCLQAQYRRYRSQ